MTKKGGGVLLSILLLSVFGAKLQGQIPYNIQKFDAPWADSNSTFVSGLYGDQLIGTYADTNGVGHGFYYNGSNWFSLNFAPTGISAARLIGTNTGDNGVSYGVVYNKLKTTLFRAPLIGGGIVGGKTNGAMVADIWAISGSKISGTYLGTDGKDHGFISSGGVAKKLDSPATQYVFSGKTNTTGPTVPTGLDGTNVVGYLYNNLGKPSGFHGFTYDGKNWATLDCPLGSKTLPSGISGSNVIGTYIDTNGVTRGFLFDGSNWTTLDDLLGDVSIETLPTGIDGLTIVGTYTDTNSLVHSFKLSPILLGSSAPPIFQPQNIIIDTNSLPLKVAYGTLPWTLNSATTSGLPVSYASSKTNVATISNTNTITLKGVGITTITLTQPGDETIYSAATPVKVTLTVFKGTQTITFTPQTTLSFVKNQVVSFSASSTSGLPVTFTSSNSTVLAISGSTAIIKGKGTAVITARRAGSANWYAAAPVPVTITVQ
jgi:hypothetical protein